MQFEEIRLKTSLLKELEYFYREILSFRVSPSMNENSITIQVGKTNLIFEASAVDASYHFAFNIPSNKIDESYTWLQQKVKVLWLPEYESHIAEFSNWNARAVYFIDPAGNIVEFIARYDLKDTVNEPFSAAYIRNVSEIGLVFRQNSFDEDLVQLFHDYPLRYFSKQPPMPNFRAVGDDNGLFIVVPEFRHWYPTEDRLSGVYPLVIRFTINNQVFFYPVK